MNARLRISASAGGTRVNENSVCPGTLSGQTYSDCQSADATLVGCGQRREVLAFDHRRVTGDACPKGSQPGRVGAVEGDVFDERRHRLSGEAEVAPVEHGVTGLGLGAEHGVVPVDPHRNGERLAREHGTREPGLHGAEAGHVRAAELMQQGPCREAVGAEAVEDGPIEPGALGELGIGVQRVAVTGQAVEQRLVGTGRVGDDVIGRPIRRLVTGP